MLTGEEKYSDWVIEYVDAWKERTAATGGNIPTNVGLDGKPGGEYNGQWWKGTYGWNFTIFDGELEQIAHRNYFTAGSWPGFATPVADAATRPTSMCCASQMDNIYAQKKVRRRQGAVAADVRRPARIQVRRAAEWYHYTPNSAHRPADRDLPLVDGPQGSGAGSENRAGSAFSKAKTPTIRSKRCNSGFENLRRNMQEIANDDTSPDTRLADYLLDFIRPKPTRC